MKKILLVFGTRPEAIKMFPVYQSLKKNSQFDVKICITGQHKEMLDQVMDLFEMKADYNLSVMAPNQTLFEVTSKILTSIKDVLESFNPDLVLVHGDTTTTFTASLASYYLKIPVGHVEAGLRTKNIYSPWPEEINRQLTGRIAKFHFAPTKKSHQNLLDEGIEDKNIYVTGNTVVDSLLHISKKIDNDLLLEEKLKNNLIKEGLNFLNVSEANEILLVTGHRRENFGTGFQNIVAALKILSTKYSTLKIVYPVHLNPNVKDLVYKELSSYENIYLLKPQDYLSFIYLMKQTKIILSDSGGIQEEAPSLGIPVLVMRDTTERPEAITAGTVKLVGTNQEAIVNEVSFLLDDIDEYKKMSIAHNPYGDGFAGENIAKLILELL
ncbi:MAG: UDP-N-acetylglucosamine 2-epimerase (non-hydrolyzing) [Candidatus Cloacimonadota bacterium]|nr:MAG: UDP-N-acetylglucosamine 2-epimerase (non-hydrolyzing) [Candidatus Cloacimonadota bacterium]